LVIFDCDGVLVDTEPISARVYAEMLTALGMAMTEDEALQTFMGRARADNQATIEQRLGRPLPGEFYRSFTERTFAAFRAELRPVPGITAALAQITLPSCVASGADHAKLEVTLGVTGLLSHFQGRIFSATQVRRGKPFPDLFLYAAEQMGTPPGRCVVVEDSIHGVQAGVAAGMTVFGYGPAAGSPRLREAGARVFSDMAELPQLL
jgi:phosphoglycolate phosphatase